jgi:hypothetical protein
MAKFTADGAFIWVKTMNGSDVVDEDGNRSGTILLNMAAGLDDDLFFSGYAGAGLIGTADCNRTLSSNSGYIAKFSKDGECAWLFTVATGHSWGDYLYFTDADPIDGSIYGAFPIYEESVSLHHNNGSLFEGFTASQGQIILAKLSRNGVVQWASTISGNSPIRAIAINSNSSDVYITGDGENTLTIKDAAGASKESFSGTDKFQYVGAFNSSGAFKWALRVEGIQATSVAVFQSDVYAIGYTVASTAQIFDVSDALNRSLKFQAGPSGGGGIAVKLSLVSSVPPVEPTRANAAVNTPIVLPVASTMSTVPTTTSKSAATPATSTATSTPTSVNFPPNPVDSGTFSSTEIAIITSSVCASAVIALVISAYVYRVKSQSKNKSALYADKTPNQTETQSTSKLWASTSQLGKQVPRADRSQLHQTHMSSVVVTLFNTSARKLFFLLD